MITGPEVDKYRQSDFDIDPIFIRRWSPRALSGEALRAEEISALFEAARWAPSAYNEQPWRFLYARRQGPHWEDYYRLLDSGNKLWAQRADLLVVVVSKQVFSRNRKPNRTAPYSTGSAWQNLALEASRRGLVAHGMSGFDYDEAKRRLSIPEGFQVEAMIAIGRPGKEEELDPSLRAGERPNGRKPLAEIICEGKFNFSADAGETGNKNQRG